MYGTYNSMLPSMTKCTNPNTVSRYLPVYPFAQSTSSRPSTQRREDIDLDKIVIR